MVKIIKELPISGSGASQVLVRKGKKFFVVSSVTAFDTGLPETLVFLADKTGKITSFGEVAGGRLVSREEAITELDSI